ncbi:hypothetical protein SAMN05421867_10771 [Cellulomonas marina]|uniref:Uncharacterized protein n=1 Tax=Cellulomonas marina TaxID=988821 RepID=A0A1I0YF74_9CELL|nr:hypothetical protein SAMN05421867_10771 [Cellulomonas marina]
MNPTSEQSTDVTTELESERWTSVSNPIRVRI